MIPGLGFGRMSNRCFPGALLRRLILVSGLCLTVAACGLPDFLGEGDDGPPLPGRRIAILTLDRGLDADPSIQDAEVRLPPPYVNNDWSHAGGSPTHAMYHLALGAAPQTVWTADLGQSVDDEAPILAQPVVVGGFVFTMDPYSVVTAFNARDGKRLWRIDLEDAAEDDGFFGGGLAYDEERLFVSTGFAKVFALDAKSGEVLWEKGVPGPVRGAPTANGGRVFVVTLDNQLVAMGASDGRRLWSHIGVQEAAGLLGSASPAVAGDVVIAPYSSGDVISLQADSGRVLWGESLATLNRIDPLADIAQIRGLPVIDRDVVYAISHSGRMVAIDLRQGVRAWEADVGGTQTPWAAGEYVFVLTNDAQLLCVRRQDGRIRWVRPLARFENEEDLEDPIRWVGPVLAGDRLIVAGSHGIAQAISPYDGSELGTLKLPGAVAAAPVVANETLYFVTENARLIAMR